MLLLPKYLTPGYRSQFLPPAGMAMELEPAHPIYPFIAEAWLFSRSLPIGLKQGITTRYGGDSPGYPTSNVLSNKGPGSYFPGSAGDSAGYGGGCLVTGYTPSSISPLTIFAVSSITKQASTDASTYSALSGVLGTGTSSFSNGHLASMSDQGGGIVCAAIGVTDGSVFVSGVKYSSGSFIAQLGTIYNIAFAFPVVAPAGAAIIGAVLTNDLHRFGMAGFIGMIVACEGVLSDDLIRYTNVNPGAMFRPATSRRFYLPKTITLTTSHSWLSSNL